MDLTVLFSGTVLFDSLGVCLIVSAILMLALFDGMYAYSLARKKDR